MHESDVLFITGLAPDGHAFFSRILRSLARIERHQRRMMRHLDIIEQGDDEEFAIVSQELDDLRREVSENKTVLEQVATKLQEGSDLVAQLKDQIAQLTAASGDPAEIEAIAQELDANTRALEQKLQPFQPSGNP